MTFVSDEGAGAGVGGGRVPARAGRHLHPEQVHHRAQQPVRRGLR